VRATTDEYERTNENNTEVLISQMIRGRVALPAPPGLARAVVSVERSTEPDLNACDVLAAERRKEIWDPVPVLL
jgi:uncharacterized linocin/CFP29 family protein